MGICKLSGKPDKTRKRGIFGIDKHPIHGGGEGGGGGGGGERGEERRERVVKLLITSC